MTHLAGVISTSAGHVPQEGRSLVAFTLLEHSACGWMMVLAFGDTLGGTAGMSWVLAAGGILGSTAGCLGVGCCLLGAGLWAFTALVLFRL